MGTVHSPKKPPARSKKAASSPAPGQGHEGLLQEETDNVMRHLMGKLSPGALDGESLASVKEKLSRSIKKHYREISGRLAAVQGEAAVGARQTPAGIAQALRSMGGSDTFNSGEAEKPAGRKKADDLEDYANRLLRQKIGAPVFALAFSADDAVAIVKCRFRDNALKPKTVTDVKLAVNITEHELVGPDVYAYASAQYLIKDLICRHVAESIDRRIDKEIDDERIAALLSDIDGARFDLSNVQGGIAQSAGLENIRTGGFNMALNALVAILDHAKLDYQCIENTRNGRELAIREYDDSDPANLPDERYALRLRYYNEEQLAQERAAHDAQLGSFEREAQLLWDLIEVNYQDSKPVFKVNDFDDLARKNKGRMRDLLKRKNAAAKAAATQAAVAKITAPQVAAPAQEIVKENIGLRFARMHERIKSMYEFLYPVERRIMEDRLAWLEKENARLDFMINPRHLRPGLLVDLEVTSIKRRKTTQNALAAALGEFLRGVYGCFRETAGAVFAPDI